jgi:hypothetical protein
VNEVRRRAGYDVGCAPSRHLNLGKGVPDIVCTRSCACHNQCRRGQFELCPAWERTRIVGYDAGSVSKFTAIAAMIDQGTYAKKDVYKYRRSNSPSWFT